jgi:transcriptional regulator with XRE-family HTH domain
MSQSEYAELENTNSNQQTNTLKKLAKAFVISIEQ